MEQRNTLNLSKNVIEMQNVSKKWGDKYAVRDVTMQVPQGQIFGLVGPSGCGKTTTVRMLTGVYSPSEGQLTVLGERPETFDKKARERIGYMPQLFVLYPTLTVWENLNFVASLYGMRWSWLGKRSKRKKRLDELLELVELTQAKHTLAHKLSGGMKRRLELAASLVHGPQLLFADEPTAGVDPVLRGKFWEYFRTLRNSGHSLLVTTQYVSEVEYCDLVGVMRGGKLLMVETPDGLRRRAFGGLEVIALHVDPEDKDNALRLLGGLQYVQKIDDRPRGQPRGTVHIHVDNAGARIAEIIHLLATDPTVDVRNTEEFTLPFDEVFIRLMEQAAVTDPESALDEGTNA